MTTKKCTKCSKAKPMSEFYENKKRKQLCTECKRCHRIRTEKWRMRNMKKCREYSRGFRQKLQANNPEEWRRRIRNSNLKAHFNMRVKDYDKMLEKQNGVCAICGKQETMTRNRRLKNLAVDHDHETGEVRALLCGHCNAGLGSFYENVEVMEKAIKYLKE